MRDWCTLHTPISGEFKRVPQPRASAADTVPAALARLVWEA
ncbi:MAG TPA: hypothetical protein PKZ84_12065 [Anaerolineae bacterium]|nr:hypothetical protein [Anaerolineae bacterium]HQI85472.1 hypothetical protein [Anaerolineae bacterium]